MENCEYEYDVIFKKNVTINGDLLINGECTTVNSNTRTITPIVYNPIEKDVELSKFILEQFKTYDLQIESLQEKIRYLEEKIVSQNSQNFTNLLVKKNDESLEEKVKRLEETVSQLYEVKHPSEYIDTEYGRVVYN